MGRGLQITFFRGGCCLLSFCLGIKPPLYFFLDVFILCQVDAVDPRLPGTFYVFFSVTDTEGFLRNKPKR